MYNKYKQHTPNLLSSIRSLAELTRLVREWLWRDGFKASDLTRINLTSKGLDLEFYSGSFVGTEFRDRYAQDLSALLGVDVDW